MFLQWVKTIPEAVANLKSGIEMDSLLIWSQFR